VKEFNQTPIPKAIRRKYGWYQWLDHFFGRERSFRWNEKKRRALYHELEKHLKSKGEGKVIPVDRHTNLSLEDFTKNYLLPNKPVVFEGGAKDWACVQNWSFDHFDALHGEDEIVVSGDSLLDKPFDVLTLHELIAQMKAGGDAYYRFYPLLEKHPEHLKDIDLAWCRSIRGKRKVGELFQVFMGGKGTGTALHNSIGSNLFTQVHGQKHWRFYPVEATMVIDPPPGKNYHRAAPYRTKEGPFDPFNPNFDPPYSLFRYLDVYDTVLQPGDVLYNPPHCWHAVNNPTDSIGLGYRWLSYKRGFSASRLYSFLDMLSLSPPPWKLYSYFKKDYNLLHIKELGVQKEFDETLKARERDEGLRNSSK